MKLNDKTKYVFRALPGILFLLSATAKLVGIDEFELYIFGLGLTGLGTSYVAARLVIAAEYTLGILLLTNLFPRLAFWGSVAMLGGFSLLLAWLMASGNHDNCHCFGEWVDFSPGESLLKNAAMLAVLLLGAGIKAFKSRYRYLFLALSVVVPLAAVLIVSPPDNWRYSSYDRSNPVNETALQEALANGTLPSSIAEGQKVVCFYSLRCNYCLMSARKLAQLRSRGDFSQAPLIVVFGRGKDTDTSAFLSESGLVPDEVHFIEPDIFLRITNGSFPLILTTEDSKVEKAFNYRNLH